MMDADEETNSKLEDISGEISQQEKQRGERLFKKSIQELWNNCERCSMYLIGIPKEDT